MCDSISRRTAVFYLAFLAPRMRWPGILTLAIWDGRPFLLQRPLDVWRIDIVIYPLKIIKVLQKCGVRMVTDDSTSTWSYYKIDGTKYKVVTLYCICRWCRYVLYWMHWLYWYWSVLIVLISQRKAASQEAAIDATAEAAFEAKALSLGLSGVVLVENVKLPVPRHRSVFSYQSWVSSVNNQ